MMESGERILMAAGLTAAVVVGAFVLWGPGGVGGVGGAGGGRGRKRRGQIAGLRNLGQTCFLNTLLQALAASPRFSEWLRKRATVDAGGSMITTLSTVLEVVNGSHESARVAGPVCPVGVLRCLGALGWVVPEDQHDAHELLHVILSCVDEETQASAKKQPGCLSDALGLFNGGIRSPGGRSECGRDELPLALFPALRSVSSPATPDSPLVKCARSLSQAAITLSEKTKNTAKDSNGTNLHPEYGSGITISRGVSRSFCHLDRLGRPAPPVPPPPQLPFHGTLSTRLQCTICSFKTPVRYDKFDSISLQLGDTPGPLSVVGLLRSFTSPEMLKGIACSRCNEGCDSSLPPVLTTHIKSQSFAKLPICLCLHVGRTQWGPSGITKRSDHVFFQETLSLAPFSSSQPSKVEFKGLDDLFSHSVPCTVGQYSSLVEAGTNGSQGDWRAMYRLQAVVVHVGGPRSGHFITYRRGNAFEAKRWFYTSDTVVHEVSLDEVLRSAAYMLFYEKTCLTNLKPPSRVPQA